MKGDAVLDLVVFELTAPRTRCELFVSADGMTEKLASGFLKPFLNHLRVVAEQVARGCESVKLECPQTYSGRSWFTKRTLERFVRFVSTPEVLERVKGIEDELVQLEQVRNIQGSGLPQVEDPFLGADPIYLRKDGKAFSGPLGICGGSKLPRRYPYDAVESGTEASKVELLRAMDVRLLALRQEQSMAFGRAAAAGFNSENMTDLMAFSEYFGADRLRMACTDFLNVSQRRVVEATKLNLQAMSSDCAMPSPDADVLSKREDLPQVSGRLSQSNQAPMSEGKHPCEDERAVVMKDGPLPAQIEETAFDGLLSKGTGGAQARKRWGHPADIHLELSGDPNQNSLERLSKTLGHQNQINAASADFNGNLVDCSQEARESANHSSESGVVPNMMVASHDLNSVSYKQTSNIAKPDASHDQEHNEDNISPPTRRLSVQDAISLFEEKKKQESVKAPRKQCPDKQESVRISMEGKNASSSRGIALRRWSVESGGEMSEVLQGSLELRKGKSNVLLPRQDLHAVTCQLYPTMELKETSGKVISTKEQNLDATFGKPLENNLQDLTHLRLEKGTAQGTLARDHAVKQGPLKGKSNLSMTRTDNFVKSESSNTVHSAKPEMSGLTGRETEKVNLSTGLQQPMPMQGPSMCDSILSMTAKGGPLNCESNLSMTSSKSGNNIHSAKPEVTDLTTRETEKGDLSIGLGHSMPQSNRHSMPVQNSSMSQDFSLEVDAVQNDSKILTASSEITQTTVIKEKHKKDVAMSIFVNPEVATNQSDQREAFGSSRVDSFQYGIQGNVSMDDNIASVDVDSQTENRGRFYEHYSKLRDAKLMEEKDTRRAQREAKLRVMEETLLLRKAELDAQTMRQWKTSYHQTRAAKLQARKDDFYILQREKEGIGERDGEISNFSNGRSISPPFASLVGKEQASASKFQNGRKPAPGSTKGGTPPRGSIRGTSVSPRLTPQSTTGSTTKPRKSAASSITENLLAKSVPSFTNLRKENTKPSAGRPSGNAGFQSEDGGSGRFRAASEAHPLEANVNVLACTPSPGNGLAKDDKLHGSFLVRKSYSDMKLVSTSSDNVLAAFKVQGEVVSETTVLSKSNSNGAGCFPVDKQSAKKGSNFGLLGIDHQSPQLTVEATYDSHEERVPISLFLESNRIDCNNQFPEEYVISLGDTIGEANMDVHVSDEADAVPDLSATNFLALQMMATANRSGEQGLQLDVQSATEGDCHAVSCPINIVAASPTKESNLRKDLECHPQSQFWDGSGDRLLSHYVANASSSFRASSGAHGLHLPVSFQGSASPPKSRAAQACGPSGHFSPLPVNTMESPLESPASWKSSQIHCASEAEISQLNKKWVSSQKLTTVVSSKEPAKGFKRLLKFARKNRALDAASADWVSTSEGDDESEDQRRSIDDLNARGRPEESIVFDISGEQKTTPDPVSAAESLRSSIPTPPTNFRLRDDHLMGGTMLKAPKSFFSLSTFRNKGIEGRAR